MVSEAERQLGDRMATIVVGSDEFIRVFMPCQCQPPRVMSVDVASVLVVAFRATHPPPEQAVLSFRCRRCGPNQVTWDRLQRAIRGRLGSDRT